MAGPSSGRQMGPNTSVEAVCEWVRKNILVSATIGAVLLGALLGSLIRLANPSSQASLSYQNKHPFFTIIHSLSLQTTMLIVFPGEVFMHMLKMMIIPLICEHTFLV